MSDGQVTQAVESAAIAGLGAVAAGGNPEVLVQSAAAIVPDPRVQSALALGALVMQLLPLLRSSTLTPEQTAQAEDLLHQSCAEATARIKEALNA